MLPGVRPLVPWNLHHGLLRVTDAARDVRPDSRAEFPTLLQHRHAGRIGSLPLLRLRFVAADGLDDVVGAILAAPRPEPIGLHIVPLPDAIDEGVLVAVVIPSQAS